MNITSDDQLNTLIHFLDSRYEQIATINFNSKESNIVWAKDGIGHKFLIDKLWSEHRFYSRDMKIVRKLRNVQYVQHRLQQVDSFSLKFRYKVNGAKFSWMQVEVVKSTAYSADNAEVIMSLKNIDESYSAEYENRRNAEKLATTDVLTGYYNRLAFDKFCAKVSSNCIGVTYIDLNRLKAVNDKQGHEAGDKYIHKCCELIDLAFARFDKYRIGGDEFVLIAEDISFEQFTSAVSRFGLLISGDHSSMPVCSIGHAWTDNLQASLSSFIATAERRMYQCKEEDYLKYHEDRRKTT